MNIAAKRIHHRKYEKKRLRLPIWALVMMIFMLTVLGYELSDKEQALRDGTHELYKEIGTGN